MNTKTKVGVLLLICNAGNMGMALEEMVKQDFVRDTN
jgi:hypothetical protein